MAQMERCVRCGTEFGCGAAEGRERCWCADLPPVMPVTDEGCLCPDCLKKEISGLLAAAGLCAACAHARRLKTKGGSTLYLCGLAAADPRFRKFPRLPVSECAGFASLKSVP